MTHREYNEKSFRFNILFEKWFCPLGNISPDELREMFALRDEMCKFDEHQSFLEAVASGEVSPIS